LAQLGLYRLSVKQNRIAGINLAPLFADNYPIDADPSIGDDTLGSSPRSDSRMSKENL
jgi:hypothetical protein